MAICEHLEPYVTFMGYSMENVRSRLGVWVRDGKGPVSQDSFRPFVETAGSVIVDLDRELSKRLTEEGVEVALRRRAVQTRLLWELQRGLAKVDNKSPAYVGNIALCILSFPSVYITAEGLGMEDTACQRNASSVFVRFDCGFRVCAMGGPQRFEVRGKLSRKGEIVSATMSVSSAQGERRFEWELWRDAFLGRLMGLKDWQEERGIQSVEFEDTLGRMDQEVVEVEAPTGEKITRWAGWKPFRFGFLQFELESEGLLKQKSVQTLNYKLRRTTEITRSGDKFISYKSINQVRTEPVEYAAASSEALRQAYLLVKEMFTVNDGTRSASSEDGVLALMAKAQKCLTDTNDTERAVFLFETAASIGGNFDAFERCIEILISEVANRRVAARAVYLLEHFIGKLISTRKGRTVGLTSVEAGKIRAGYEKVIERFGDFPQICRLLPGVLETVAWSDPDVFLDSVLSRLQMMYCMNESERVLSIQAMLMSEYASVSFNANIQLSWDIICTNTGRNWIRNEVRRDIMQYCTKLCRNIYSNTREELSSEILLDLAGILLKHANIEPRNAKEAETLYRRAIDEGNAVAAMNNLALLYKNGADGVAVNAREAEMLYRRAIDEGNHVAAMNNLAFLYQNGADGVASNAKEAKTLYRRAIDEGNDVTAMNNLALLYQNGADGVASNAREAETLYRRAIDEGNDVDAMNNLALLYENGADGVAVNTAEAAMLYRRAADEGNLKKR